jgi:hypothetical protein
MRTDRILSTNDQGERQFRQSHCTPFALRVPSGLDGQGSPDTWTRVLPEDAGEKGRVYVCPECLRYVYGRGGSKPYATKRVLRRHFALFPRQHEGHCVYLGAHGPSAAHRRAVNAAESAIRRCLAGLPRPMLEIECDEHGIRNCVALPVPLHLGKYEIKQDRKLSDINRRPDVALYLDGHASPALTIEVLNTCGVDWARATALSQRGRIWFEVGAHGLNEDPPRWIVTAYSKDALGELRCCLEARERKGRKQREEQEWVNDEVKRPEDEKSRLELWHGPVAHSRFEFRMPPSATLRMSRKQQDELIRRYFARPTKAS